MDALDKFFDGSDAEGEEGGEGKGQSGADSEYQLRVGIAPDDPYIKARAEFVGMPTKAYSHGPKSKLDQEYVLFFFKITEDLGSDEDTLIVGGEYSYFISLDSMTVEDWKYKREVSRMIDLIASMLDVSPEYLVHSDEGREKLFNFRDTDGEALIGEQFIIETVPQKAGKSDNGWKQLEATPAE